MWFSSLCIFFTISHQCLRRLIFCSSIRTDFTMTCINLIEFILYTVKCIWFCMGLYLYLHCFTVFVFAMLHCIWIYIVALYLYLHCCTVFVFAWCCICICICTVALYLLSHSCSAAAWELVSRRLHCTQGALPGPHCQPTAHKYNRNSKTNTNHILCKYKYKNKYKHKRSIINLPSLSWGQPHW